MSSNVSGVFVFTSPLVLLSRYLKTETLFPSLYNFSGTLPYNSVGGTLALSKQKSSFFSSSSWYCFTGGDANSTE